MKLLNLLREDDMMTGGPCAEDEENAVALMDEAKELMLKSKYAEASDLASKAAKILSRIANNKVNYGTNT